METTVCKVISVFFLICWLVFEFYIIDIMIDTKQYRNIMWKIIIPTMFLGICAFLCGVCMGNLM